MLKAMARRARNAARSTGLYSPPGHYYSPSTSADDRRRQLAWDLEPSIPGVDVNEEAQLALAGRIAATGPLVHSRWNDTSANAMFGHIDASLLQGILTVCRPQRIIEVGSGFSTAVMLDTADHAGTTKDITCIEPYAQRLRSTLRTGDDITIIERPVQDVPVNVFTDLRDGDLLFIDSTHVAKSGSDVLYLYLEVLPRLAHGVVVHAHDIFWPFSYREEWLVEGRDWTEAYLLRALLTDTDRWRVELFADWLYGQHPQEAAAIAPASDRPGSIYLRRD
jgi:predicted O-methyltransferase YrrM